MASTNSTSGSYQPIVLTAEMWVKAAALKGLTPKEGDTMVELFDTPQAKYEFVKKHFPSALIPVGSSSAAQQQIKAPATGVQAAIPLKIHGGPTVLRPAFKEVAKEVSIFDKIARAFSRSSTAASAAQSKPAVSQPTAAAISQSKPIVPSKEVVPQPQPAPKTATAQPQSTVPPMVVAPQPQPLSTPQPEAIVTVQPQPIVPPTVDTSQTQPASTTATAQPQSIVPPTVVTPQPQPVWVPQPTVAVTEQPQPIMPSIIPQPQPTATPEQAATITTQLQPIVPPQTYAASVSTSQESASATAAPPKPQLKPVTESLKKAMVRAKMRDMTITTILEYFETQADVDRFYQLLNLPATLPSYNNFTFEDTYAAWNLPRVETILAKMSMPVIKPEKIDPQHKTPENTGASATASQPMIKPQHAVEKVDPNNKAPEKAGACAMGSLHDTTTKVQQQPSYNYVREDDGEKLFD